MEALERQIVIDGSMNAQCRQRKVGKTLVRLCRIEYILYASWTPCKTLSPQNEISGGAVAVIVRGKDEGET